jgi:cellulase/cellobiase CelA1
VAETFSTHGVVTKYKVSRPGRWSRLIAWCYFHADPRTVQVIVYKNGTATSLAVALNSTGPDTEDTQTDYDETHAVSFAEGDTMDIRVQNVVPLDTFDQIRGISATVLEQLFG